MIAARSTAAACLICGFVTLFAQPAYVVKNGAIAIIGYNDMSEIFAGLNELFIRSHPGVQFEMQLKGTATAAPALTFGVSAFAPMGAEFSAMELEAYRSFVGADPIPIRVAHCSMDPRARSAPVGIFVHRQNPIEKLTTEQVARIFTAGNSKGDITRWGQLGLPGEWTARPIHPCGIAEEAAAGLAAFMLARMGGRSFTAAYDGFSQSTEVVRRVGEDPMAIGFASANLVTPETKLVAVDGTNAYDRYLYIYIRRVPGEPIDSFVRDYLRLVLSTEGQQAIAAALPRYVPLTATEAKEELAKVEALPHGEGKNGLLGETDSIRVAGSEGTVSLLQKLNKRFVETHPGLKLSTLVKGLPAVAIYSIVTDIAAFALIDREIWPLEVRPFRQVHGYEPTAIRIGRAAKGRGNAPRIYVNAGIPLRAVTVDQVTRVFTTGERSGDITHWGQLGLSGEWSERAIHIYGPRDDGSLASAIRHSKMGGFPFARRYEPLSNFDQVIQAVADDPYGMGLAGFGNPKPASGAVKMVLDFSQYLTLYVNRAPGKPLDPVILGYARMMLSGEGQAIVASAGHLPLTQTEMAAELAKLGR